MNVKEAHLLIQFLVLYGLLKYKAISLLINPTNILKRMSKWRGRYSTSFVTEILKEEPSREVNNRSQKGP